jgi:hypothetical protein
VKRVVIQLQLLSLAILFASGCIALLLPMAAEKLRFDPRVR